MFYKPKYFIVQELVDEATFARFGDRAWMFFNPVFLDSLDRVRVHFGKPVTLNNWHQGGALSQRGLRVATGVGATHSQHRFGNAGDYDVSGLTADEVRAEVLGKQGQPAFELITCLEEGVSWVHHDCRNIGERIRLIRP